MVSKDRSPGNVPTAAPVEIAAVIVTRNMAAGLEFTIKSLLSIGDPRICIYVVDGASSDGSVAFLRDIKKINWISEPDAGIYDAMNKGWAMPPLDAYMLYLGAGDRVMSLPSTETMTRLHSEGTDIIIGTCAIGREIFTSSWHEGLYVGNTAHHQALLVRKSLNPQPPFDIEMKVYADWDFNLRLFARGLKAHFDESFKSYADPGGVSAVHNLSEAWLVAKRHGGFRAGIRAYRANLREKLKVRFKKARLLAK